MDKNLKEQLQLKAQLGQKIETVSQAIGKMKRDGRNSNSNYLFISNDVLMATIRGNLLRHQLGIIPEVISYEERDFTSAKGSVYTRSMVSMRFEITDLETGFSKEAIFAGADQDYGGKSFQQAVTQATKYFYFKLFKVSPAEEPNRNPQRVAIQQQAQNRKGSQYNTLSKEAFSKMTSSIKLGKVTFKHGSQKQLIEVKTGDSSFTYQLTTQQLADLKKPFSWSASDYKAIIKKLEHDGGDLSVFKGDLLSENTLGYNGLSISLNGKQAKEMTKLLNTEKEEKSSTPPTPSKEQEKKEKATEEETTV